MISLAGCTRRIVLFQRRKSTRQAGSLFLHKKESDSKNGDRSPEDPVESLRDLRAICARSEVPDIG
jgi:hypothetical protein